MYMNRLAELLFIELIFRLDYAQSDSHSERSQTVIHHITI